MENNIKLKKFENDIIYIEKITSKVDFIPVEFKTNIAMNNDFNEFNIIKEHASKELAYYIMDSLNYEIIENDFKKEYVFYIKVLNDKERVELKLEINKYKNDIQYLKTINTHLNNDIKKIKNQSLWKNIKMWWNNKIKGKDI